MGLWLFENMLRDENGEPFEDMKTVEDVKAVGVFALRDLINEIESLFSRGSV